MPITQQPNDNNNRKSIISTGYQFYNENATMVVSFWNDIFISIKMYPALPESERTETRQYDYDKGVTTAINSYKSSQLFAQFGDITRAFDNGEEASYYVDVSGNNLIGIGTKKIDIKGEKTQVCYLAIHKNLNENKIPEKSFYFYFGDKYIIKDYNPNTGDYRQTITKSGDFITFMDILRSQSIAANKAIAHSVKVVLNSTFNKFDMKIDAIANNLKVKYPNSYSSRYQTGKKLFGNSSQSDTEEMDSVMRKAEEAIDNNSYPDDDVDLPF